MGESWGGGGGKRRRKKRTGYQNDGAAEKARDRGILRQLRNRQMAEFTCSRASDRRKDIEQTSKQRQSGTRSYAAYSREGSERLGNREKYQGQWPRILPTGGISVESAAPEDRQAANTG
jgi:hypothetical protein